jgi:NAD(P)-dependent dehydrogenase (short-subunit alcohol dehydrogenase family)
VSEVLFPLWQIDRDEYAAACAYLGLTPNPLLYERLSAHLARLPFTAPRPAGFALYLVRTRLTRFRIARLDQTTKLFFPAHPVRHVLNAVIALHECDGRGSEELARTRTGPAVWVAIAAAAVRFALGLSMSLPWLAWQALKYAAALPLRPRTDLDGRQVLITGAARGLGRDLLLLCLERGASVTAAVRTEQAREELARTLPAEAPVRWVVADLSQAGSLSTALQEEGVSPRAVDMAIACAGTKHAGDSALSLEAVRRTFEVNLFGAAELAAWFCGGDGSSAAVVERPRSLVLVSSMGRWHGMHGSGGYNASKAALSIWGESLEMDLRRTATKGVNLTIVEPGLFVSAMTRQAGLSRWLLAPRRKVAEAIVAGALAGRKAIRPPFWFALLTWGACLAGRSFRARLFGRAKPGAD